VQTNTYKKTALSDSSLYKLREKRRLYMTGTFSFKSQIQTASIKVPVLSHHQTKMHPPPPILHTPRLTLIRLTDTSPGSHHVQLFHDNWSDPDITIWSLHGPCHSLEESRQWMIHHMTVFDNYFYAVFAKQHSGSVGTEDEILSTHVGSVSLRKQDAPTLAPPRGEEGEMRVLGYAVFKREWGKGYATEANRALLEAYGEANREEGKNVYVEACVDDANPGSVAVLKKLGFEEVGWKEEPGRVFLGGAWREGGCWVYGKYV
jgi:RimJ/RimL family protein N-acetyltransferase